MKIGIIDNNFNLKNKKISRNSKTNLGFKSNDFKSQKADKIKKEFNITTGAKIDKNIYPMLTILSKNAYNPEQKNGQMHKKIIELAPLLCDDSIITAYNGHFSNSIIVSHPVFRYTIAKDYSTNTYGCAPDINNSDIYTLANHINEQIVYGKEKGWSNSLHKHYVKEDATTTTEHQKTVTVKEPSDKVLNKLEQSILYGTGIAAITAATIAGVKSCETDNEKTKNEIEITSSTLSNNKSENDSVDYIEEYNNTLDDDE